jgi:quinol monooxygenase YgiN
LANTDRRIVFASFRPKADQTQALEELLGWMAEHTRQEPGCLQYDLFTVSGDKVSYHLFERYQDTAALDAHRAADYYKQYRQQVQDLLDAPIDVLVLAEVDVKD